MLRTCSTYKWTTVIIRVIMKKLFPGRIPFFQLSNKDSSVRNNHYRNLMRILTYSKRMYSFHRILYILFLYVTDGICKVNVLESENTPSYCILV